MGLSCVVIGLVGATGMIGWTAGFRVTGVTGVAGAGVDLVFGNSDGALPMVNADRPIISAPGEPLLLVVDVPRAAEVVVVVVDVGVGVAVVAVVLMLRWMF